MWILLYFDITYEEDSRVRCYIFESSVYHEFSKTESKKQSENPKTFFISLHFENQCSFLAPGKGGRYWDMVMMYFNILLSDSVSFAS